MDPFNNLEEIFRKFPGIGPRQAKRFVYHLLSLQQSDIDKINDNISKLKNITVMCSICCRFFSDKYNSLSGKTENAICPICSDENRDNSCLMILSKDVDLLAVEKSRSYNGSYFVLGDNIQILEENPSLKIREKELLRRIEMYDKTILKEIIIATSANPEGDNTAEYINSLLKSRLQINGNSQIKITMLGRGLSTGSELEYSDNDTIKNALSNRRLLKQ